MKRAVGAHGAQTILAAVAVLTMQCGQDRRGPRTVGAAGERSSARAVVPSTNATSSTLPTREPVVRASSAQDEPQCSVEQHTRTAQGWRLLGFNPGPAIDELVSTQPRRLAAIVSRRVCTSDDVGQSWTERLAASPGSALELDRINREGAWVAVARDARVDGARNTDVSTAYVSRDGGERWNAVQPPQSSQRLRTVFGDGQGRLFAATATELFESSDFGASWSQPRVLPGREARSLDACGTLMIAQTRVDNEWLYQRSLDHGGSWRPLRLSSIGLDSSTATLRCLSDVGGIEAGRGAVPTHWSFDSGRTWEPADYDVTARQQARALGDDPRDADLPRCTESPEGGLACIDPGRVRLLGRSVRSPVEIHAPSNCEHVRAVEGGHAFAFGPSCGIYVSQDRGGLWRRLSQSLIARSITAPSDGRGGFLNGRIAWRLDGDVWWTFDGGEHWRPQRGIGNRELERGVFVDTARGVFVTRTGWLVSTRDGGRTWTHVLRGEVERIATAQRMVVVTTAQSVRVSLNGGVTWRAANSLLPTVPLDPTVETLSSGRAVALQPGLRVLQQGDRIALEQPTGGVEELVSGLPLGYNLLAAHAAADGVDRVLLEGGVVLARASVERSTHPRRARSSRPHRRHRRGHG